MATKKKRKTTRKKKRLSLDDTILDFRDEFGDVVVDFSSSRMNIDYIECGIEDIDKALGGGLPRGRMIELFGPESCVDGDSFIQYAVWTPDGRQMNHKGGTIRRLWERFHGESASGDGRGKYLRPFEATFAAPSVNEEDRIFHNQIEDVVRIGKRGCFELTTLGGEVIVATSDHKFFDGTRYRRLSDLIPGDVILVHTNVHFTKEDSEVRTSEDIVFSICPVGEREVFDLKMRSPFNNYVVDRFVTHNSGKTSITLKFAAAVQAAGGRIAIIDAEHALVEEWANKIGVDLRKNCILVQPDSGEQALNITRRLVKKNLVDLVMIDSVAALVPEKELERDIGQVLPGAQARLISQACRILAGDLAKSTTVVVWINQIRMRVGVMYGNPEVTPGGNALKFYSSVRIDVRRKQAIRRPKKGVVGFETQIKIVKNKMAPPLKVAMCVIDFERGVRAKRKTKRRKKRSA